MTITPTERDRNVARQLLDNAIPLVDSSGSERLSDTNHPFFSKTVAALRLETMRADVKLSCSYCDVDYEPSEDGFHEMGHGSVHVCRAKRIRAMIRAQYPEAE